MDLGKMMDEASKAIDKSIEEAIASMDKQLELANRTAADRFIAEFHTRLDELNREEDRAFRADASAGAAVFRLDELTTIEKCIKESDETLYRRKEERRAQKYRAEH